MFLSCVKQAGRHVRKLSKLRRITEHKFETSRRVFADWDSYIHCDVEAQHTANSCKDFHIQPSASLWHVRHEPLPFSSARLEGYWKSSRPVPFCVPPAFSRQCRNMSTIQNGRPKPDVSAISAMKVHLLCALSEVTWNWIR